jgi:carbonic anhydrase
MGSNTQPPCAENVLWLIVDEPLKISTTITSLLKDSLLDPIKPTLKGINLGNNRFLTYI